MYIAAALTFLSADGHRKLDAGAYRYRYIDVDVDIDR